MDSGLEVALLVIDVQQELFQKSIPIYRSEQLLININGLIDKAHQAGAPVIFIQHCGDCYLVKGTPGWQLHPNLTPLSDDIIMTKEHPNAFEGTTLRSILNSKGIKRLVITGLVTHGCVKATCQGGKKLNFQVTLVEDAHSNFSKTPDEIIQKTQQKLENAGIILKNSNEIDFY